MLHEANGSYALRGRCVFQRLSRCLFITLRGGSLLITSCKADVHILQVRYLLHIPCSVDYTKDFVTFTQEYIIFGVDPLYVCFAGRPRGS